MKNWDEKSDEIVTELGWNWDEIGTKSGQNQHEIWTQSGQNCDGKLIYRIFFTLSIRLWQIPQFNCDFNAIFPSY